MLNDDCYQLEHGIVLKAKAERQYSPWGLMGFGLMRCVAIALRFRGVGWGVQEAQMVEHAQKPHRNLFGILRIISCSCTTCVLIDNAPYGLRFKKNAYPT